jgi:transcriptional regulator with XRE-family HTH domain
MPQVLKPLEPHLSGKHRFGAELRAVRIGSGMSQAQLAKLVHVHPDLIAKVEKATRWPTEALATSCDSALDTGGRLAALWPGVADERRRKDKQPGPTAAPREADLVDVLEPIGEVAGRLWRLGDAAMESALSVLQSGIADIVERYETDHPATLAPDAVALRRDLGSMIEARPSTSQRRLLLGVAGRTSGLLAYMAVNLGRFAHADAYSIEAYALAKAAGDRGLMAWVRGTQSFASYYRRDYTRAVEYARDGLRTAGRGRQALRLKVNCEARALAFLPGHERDAERAVTQAYTLADRLDVPEGISPCISFRPYSRGRVVANAITVFQTLGEADRAVDLLQEIEGTLQTSNSAWSRSLIDLDHATTLLQGADPDVEQAMRLACSALVASADRPITSVLERGQALGLSVARFGNLPAVREFQERLHMIVVVGDRRRRGLSTVRDLRS